MGHEQIEKQGNWWLPGRDHERVAGRLIFGPDGYQLDLIGALSHPFGSRQTEHSDAGNYGVVHGEAGGDYFTLLDCFRSKITGQILTGTAVESIHVNMALEGLLFDDDEMVGGDALSASMRHLPHWMAQNGLNRSRFWGDQDNGRFGVIEAVRVPSVEVELSGGVEMQLRQVLSDGGDDITESALRQTFVAKVLTPGRSTPLDELIKMLGTFQHLVSIGSDAPAAFEEVYLWHPDAQRNGHAFGTRVHAQWSDSQTAPAPKRAHEMAFTWREIDDTSALVRWMETGSRYRGPLQRVMASRARDGLFLDDRLLHRCAALEAFDRERTGSRGTKFKARLARCIELAGPEVTALVGEPDVWAEAMRRERDEVAHQFGQLPHDTARLLFLGESAYWLFVLCMLREAGMPEAVIEGVTSSKQWRWVGDNLRDAIGLDGLEGDAPSGA